MPENDEKLEKIVMTRLLRLNAMAHGIAAALVLGLAIFAATLWLVIKGGEVVGPHLVLLSQYFIGYSVSVGGSIVGFLYGFIVGFATGYLVAHTYNWFAGQRETRRYRRIREAQATSPAVTRNEHDKQTANTHVSEK